MAGFRFRRARGAVALPGFLLGVTSVLVPAMPARGADPVETIVVRARPLEHPTTTAPTASRTTIFVDTRPQPADSVTELLAEIAGVQVRRFGGLGAFSTVSIRGSAANQVRFFFDGVPLSRARTDTVNLGSLPLESLERVEVYRGTMPIALGGGAAAGAVNLVPRRPGPVPRTHLEAGYGSFSTRRATAGHGRRAGPFELLGHVSYLGSAGNFTYFTDRNTPQQPADDGRIRRQNNDFDSVEGLLRAAWPRSGGARLDLTAELYWKSQGVPGAGFPQTERPALREVRSLNYLRWRDPAVGGTALDVAATLFGTFERLDFDDPLGELGPGNQRRADQTSSAGADLALSWHQWETVVPALFVQAVRDVFAGFNELAPPGLRDEPNQERLSLVSAAQMTLSLLAGRLLVVPTVRFQHVRDRTSASFDLANRPTGPSLTRARDLWSPSLGIQLRLFPWLTLRANAGVYRRPPSFAELFGARGSTRPNPTLRDERAFNRDAGFVLTLPSGRLWANARITYTFFDNELDDLITFVSAGTGTVRPLNIGSARMRGHEVAATATFARHVRITVNHTQLDTEDRGGQPAFRGKELPGRPGSETYLRTELFGPAGGAYYELSAVGGNSLVRSGFIRAPARTIHTAGVLFHPLPAVTLTVEGRNLTAAQASDVFRFPLPGRAFFVTAEVRR